MPNPVTEPRIVVVDDDDTVRFLVVQLLSGAVPHASLRPFSTAREALDVILRGEADLLITDCQMPGMDGPSLVAAVRKQAIELPIIMVSGSDEAAELGAKAGIDRFVPKDRISSELLACVRALLGPAGQNPA